MKLEYQAGEIRKAYSKFKSHVYYDSTELFQRKQIAIFETGLDEKEILSFHSIYKYDRDLFGQWDKISFDEKFEIIAKHLTNYHDTQRFFEHFLNQINIIALPKKFTKLPSQKDAPDNFITNQREDDKYEIEKVTLFIEMPVELHIICVLWLMHYGYRLDKNLHENCLGNRLILNKDRSAIIEGSGLFKPYYSQYQKWRDNAVEEAQGRLTKKENVALINLDIKDYFYSVRLNFEEVEKECFIDTDSNLHVIFKRIHEIFTDKLIEKEFPHNKIGEQLNGKSILPIGLTSSYVLANWFLKEFDKRVVQKIKPVYFSRYVDDILIIIPNPDFDFNKNEPCESIKFSFSKYKAKQNTKNNLVDFEDEDLTNVERFILETFYPIVTLINFPEELKSEKERKEKKSRIFSVTCTPDCYFQSSKTLLYFFDHTQSTAVIDKLKQELEERTSEFRDFPEESNVNASFDEQAYHLIFDGSEGKIRTLKDYKENRYGLSVFLANRIFAALRKQKKVDKTESKKILKLFKGQNTLEYFRLWEKIFTYFLVNDDQEGFVEFYEHTLEQIEKAKYLYKKHKVKLAGSKVRKSLLNYFDLAVELTLSLNPNFVKGNTKAAKKLEITQNKNNYNIELFYRATSLTNHDSFYITRFRRSNLVRHYYVAHPLLNYTNAARSYELNLVDMTLPKQKFKKENALDFNSHSLETSPRRVKFWECCIAIANQRVLKNKIENGKVGERHFFTNILGNEINPDEEFYLDEAFKLYEKINGHHYSVLTTTTEERKKQFFDRNQFDICKVAFDPSISINEFRIDAENKFSANPKISLANTLLDEANFIKSLEGEPELTSERYEVFAKLLNASREEKADLFLMPECSVPYELVSSFAKYAERSQMLIVAGLEHWVANKISHNFLVTIVPFSIDGIKDAVVLFRLKNHYSHHEEKEVRGRGLVVPKPSTYRYDLINWRGLYFAPYYCVELADIYHRSIFRSKLDLVIASEWNKDTPYFSNIVESLARDLHCYIAQVNNSEFGDSRLTQPTETAKKDILKLKGGINHTILVGEIDLNKLREFQAKYYELTENDNSFKPVPPDMKIKNVKKRQKNEKQY